MTDRQAPPLPAEVDLRDFAYMPLDVRRLLTSETWVLGRAEEKVAAINLWCESWHQVPSGSLPDNDRMLAHLSQAGAAWKKVRGHAMRGWVLCSDGRWYHPVIVEKARESWEKKVAQRQRTQRATQARWKGKPPPDDPGPPSGTDSVTETSTDSATDSVTDPVTFTKGEGREGKRSELTLAPRAPEPDPDPEPSPPQTPNPAVLLAVEARRHGIACHGSDPRLVALAARGVTAEALRAACEEAKRRKGAGVGIGYVAAIVDGWSADAARIAAGAPATPTAPAKAAWERDSDTMLAEAARLGIPVDDDWTLPELRWHILQAHRRSAA
ncbi:MAG: DUF1376 domain-containing protein [Burkholderiales bacterium]